MVDPIREAELRYIASRNAMDSSTLGGRKRTSRLLAEWRALKYEKPPPIDTSKLGPITTLPDAADELAKAIDAIQAAEGALCRAQGIVATEVLRLTLEAELRVLRGQRQRLLVLRGGPKAEPSHFVGRNRRA